MKFMQSYLSLAAALLLSACTGAQTFTIQGTLPDASHDGRTIYLSLGQPLPDATWQHIDSAVVCGSQFILQGTADDSLRLGIIHFMPLANDDHGSGIQIPVILEPGQVTVACSGDEVSLQGSPLNDLYETLVLQAGRRMRQANKEAAEGDVEAYRANADTFMLSYAQFVRRVAGTPAGDCLYFSYPADRYPEADRQFLHDAADPAVFRRIAVRDSLRREREREFQESKRAVTVGSHYRDISGRTPEGEPVSLSQLIVPGHVTLLDFWASWCGPCRQEIPFLKDLYARYHDRGFDIIACSLDHSESAWLRALDKEQMPWPQFSELQGWNGSITQQYGIQAIPYDILLDRQGNVCLLNLHAQLLVDEIERQLDTQVNN